MSSSYNCCVQKETRNYIACHLFIFSVYPGKSIITLEGRKKRKNALSQKKAQFFDTVCNGCTIYVFHPKLSISYLCQYVISLTFWHYCDIFCWRLIYNDLNFIWSYLLVLRLIYSLMGFQCITHSNHNVTWEWFGNR